DILKDQAIIDFRGKSDLVPDYDTIQMRGFDATRFVTAVDGLNIQTAGGIGTTQVDYGTLPLGLIESIEILPGPHSALYLGTSEGGVVNLKTKTPERYTTLKPDFRVATSYRSYNTQNHSVNIDGGAGSFIYGLGFQNYHTDGYLRHNETDINNYSWRLGYILPNDAYISLNMTYTDRDKERVAKNDPILTDYKSHYPETPTASKEEWEDNTWDEEAESYRLNYRQPTPVGLWTLGAYYSKRDRDYSYLRYIDKKDKAKGLYRYHSESERSEIGGRIQDEIKFSENHITTVGFDMTLGYSGPFKYTYYDYKTSGTPRRKKFDIKGGYLEHKWTIIPRLTVTPGLRYEDVKTWHNNYNFTKNEYYVKSIHKKFIDREYNQLVPKSFLTYELD
ncbi:TonB-dependent receptor, partial [bacterium]|nr:TonB-dependent receptor [bacterium]